MIHRDIEYSGDSSGYTGGYYAPEEPKEPKNPKNLISGLKFGFLL
jgi:hypothetical protein